MKNVARGMQIFVHESLQTQTSFWRAKSVVYDAFGVQKVSKFQTFTHQKKLPCTMQRFRARCKVACKKFRTCKLSHTKKKFSRTMHLARKKFRTCKISHTRKVFVHDAFGAQKVSNLQTFTHKKSFRARCIWRAKCFGATCNFRARKFANSNKVFGMQDVAPECLKFRARQFCKLKTKFSACKMSGAYLQSCHRLLDKFRVLPTRRNVCFFNQDFFFQFQLQNKKCQSKPVKSAQTRKWRPRQSNKPTRRRRSNEQIRQKNRRPWKRSIASVNVVPTAGLICRTCSTDH